MDARLLLCEAVRQPFSKGFVLLHESIDLGLLSGQLIPQLALGRGGGWARRCRHLYFDRAGGRSCGGPKGGRQPSLRVGARGRSPLVTGG